MKRLIIVCLLVGLNGPLGPHEAAGQTTRTLVYIDPYRGVVAAEQGSVIAPLYEATFQIMTKELVGWTPMPLRSYVGAPVSQSELPGLGAGELLRFWTDEYIQVYPYQDGFEFGFVLESLLGNSVRDLRQDYLLVALPPQALFHLAWSDATGQPQQAVRRASVQQVGQLKVLCVLRSVFVIYLDRTSGAFLVDVWAAVFPSNVDLLFQTVRYPIWP